MPCRISRFVGPYLLSGALSTQQNTPVDPQVLLNEQKCSEDLYQM